MKKGDFAKAKLIQLMMTHKKMILNGGEEKGYPDFIQEMQASKDKKDSRIGYTSKTIKSYVNELTDEGYFIKEGDVYSLNNDKFWNITALSSQEMEILFNAFIKSGDGEAQINLLNYIRKRQKNNVIDQTYFQKYDERIKVNSALFKSERENMNKINHALTANKKITVQYEGVKKSIFPICYVLNREGTEAYLFYIRRNNLEPPMRISKVQVISIDGEITIDRTPYIHIINRLWNVDNQKPVKVKVVINQRHPEYNMAARVIKKYLRPTEEYNGFHAYEGEIYGMNDFKVWLRRHSEVCAIIEPQYLCEELRQSVTEQLRRYTSEVSDLHE